MRPAKLSIAACVALLVFWFAPTLAPAAPAGCEGTNLLDDLARSDPAAHAAIRARAEATPNGEGRFWRVERPGVEASHLFGTFHTGQAVGSVPPAVWQALERARVALFELSAAEQNAMQARLAADPAFAFDAAGAPLSSRLDARQKEVVAQALATRGIAFDRAEHMQPWMLFSLLALPACHLEAMAAGAVSLDTALARSADAAGVQQAGLETYEEALAAFRRIPPDRLLAMLAGTSALVDREEDLFRTNLDLYGDGRIAEIDAFGRWLAAGQGADPDSEALYRELMAWLIDARNRAWLDPLEAAFARGNAFAAVGALHLPGDAGLIELLRAEGWTVSRVD